MRPRFTVQKALLLVVALGILTGLVRWLSHGAPLPGSQVPSTAGRIAYVSDRNGHPDLWMMKGSDGTEAIALTNDTAEERAPAWSRNGEELAFLSDRRGGNMQVFLTEARPESTARQLTITSSSKNTPIFGKDGRVYYLSAGQLVATAPGTSDTDAILPSAENRQPGGSDPLASGGFSWAEPAPAPKSVAAVLQTENSAVLLFSPPGAERPLFLGLAQKIVAAWLPDNTLVAAFYGGGPVQQPFPLPNTGTIPAAPERKGGYVVHFDASGTPTPVLPVPFAPSGIATSPLGSEIVLTSETDVPGVFVLSLTDAQPQLRQIYDKSATSPTWSPDGKTLAFVGGSDIWTVPADASSSTSATNRTNGKQGVCSAPTWSPTKAQASP